MKPIFEDIPLLINEGKKRFEIEIEGNVAFINFSKFGSQIALTHTETDPKLAGSGAANALVEKTLQYVESQQFKLLPFCPFVFTFIRRHPEWKRIVSTKYKDYDKI